MISIVYQFIIAVPQIYYISESEEKSRLTLDYSTTAFCLLIGTWSMVISLIYKSETQQCLEDLKRISWPLKRLSMKRLINEVKRPFLVMTFSSFMYIFGVYYITPFRNSEKETFLAREVFAQYFPQYCIIFTNIFDFMFIFLLLASTVNSIIFIYCLFHLRPQMIVLNYQISKIPNGFQNEDEITLYHSSAYQDVIHQRLRSCIRHHVNLTCFVSRSMNIFWVPIQMQNIQYIAVNFFFIVGYFNVDC